MKRVVVVVLPLSMQGHRAPNPEPCTTPAADTRGAGAQGQSPLPGGERLSQKERRRYGPGHDTRKRPQGPGTAPAHGSEDHHHFRVLHVPVTLHVKYAAPTTMPAFPPRLCGPGSVYAAQRGANALHLSAPAGQGRWQPRVSKSARQRGRPLAVFSSTVSLAVASSRCPHGAGAVPAGPERDARIPAGPPRAVRRRGPRR